jgi:lipoate-protein ligase A
LLGGAALYERVNRAILHALRLLGIEAQQRGPGAPGSGGQRGCFFCFARPSATDIIATPPADRPPVAGQAGPRKLAGSAQRRRRGGVLQHGSILLQADEPEAIGVGDLVPALPAGVPQDTFGALAAALVRGFEANFGAAFQERELSADERGRAQQICRSRYADLNWLRSAGRPARSCFAE